MMGKVIFCCPILFFVLGLFTGCATTPQGPPKPGIPKISNLTVPKAVILGQRFPISFQFEDSEADITTVTITYEWSSAGGATSSESKSFDPQAYGKTNGICEISGFVGRLPPVFSISVYVEDA